MTTSRFQEHPIAWRRKKGPSTPLVGFGGFGEASDPELSHPAITNASTIPSNQRYQIAIRSLSKATSDSRTAMFGQRCLSPVSLAAPEELLPQG